MSASRVATVSLLAVILPLSAAPAPGAEVWVEGETAATSDCTRHSWYDSVDRESLSGGDWLSHYDPQRDGSAEYVVEVPEAGSYRFWLRANPLGTMKYRVDGGEWRPVGFADSRDRKNVAADGHLDLRFLAWTRLDPVKLAAGSHRIAVRFESENAHHGGLDAFLLTTGSFTPAGAAKPGERPPAEFPEQADTWAFNMDIVDPYAPSVIDLRQLNEKVAGQHGFVRLSEDGNSFVRGDGEPLRFWGASLGIDIETASDTDAARHARFYARMGVNLVRVGGKGINPRVEGSDITDVNEPAVRRLQRAVAVMGREGIYTSITHFWGLAGFVKYVNADWGIEGYGPDNTNLLGLLFFEPTLQKGYKAWMRKLLTEPNPYTGIPLKDDPALAIIEIQNEDSLLFWTFRNITGGPRKLLEQRFGQWAARKYGSIEAALSKWDDQAVEGDAPDEGRLGLEHVYQFTLDVPQINARRVRDQLEFMVDLQRRFHADMVKFFRDELGCKQLIYATNWTTADKVRLDDLERYTYAAADIIASNCYYDSGHIGEHNGYQIEPRHFYQGRSVTRRPRALPALRKQVVGHPFIVTETLWVPPTKRESEGPLMMAGYMAMNGLDACVWNSPRGVAYDPDPYRPWVQIDGSVAMDKWNCGNPGTLSQFPAAALIYRKGYVDEGPVAVHEERALDDMLDRRIPMLAEGFSFDPNRYAANYTQNTDIPGGVDPLAFLTGRVEVVYGGEPSKSYVAKGVDAAIDRANQTVRSLNGQLAIHYGTGLFRMDAPKAQAVAGFLAEAGGRFELSNALIESASDYASIALVSLDDQPLATSRQVLLQVGTVSEPSGWKEEPATHTRNDEQLEGFRIISTGSMPWRVRNAKGAVTLRNPNVSRAVRLNEAGQPVGELPVERTDAGLRIELPPDALYIILK
jgi:hypothetical protein